MQAEKESELTLFNSSQETNFYEYKADIEKICEGLEKFGLRRNQARVFMYLGKYGPKTSREVGKALNMPRTETYGILNSLINLGIITSKLEHPTKFTALPMNKAISVMMQAAHEDLKKLEKKEIELTKLWNKIPSTSVDTVSETEEKFQMLKGWTRINNKIKELITSCGSECNILCTDRDLSRLYYSNFIERLSSLPFETKIVVSPSQKLPDYIRMIEQSKIRILPQSEVDNQCFIIKDSSEVLLLLRNVEWPSRNLFAFWTDASSLVKSMKFLFHYSWNNALPLDFEKYLQTK